MLPIAAILTAALAQPVAPSPAAPPSGPHPAPNPNPNLHLSSPHPFQQEIPSAAYKLDLLPIPGDPAKGIKSFWMSKAEITWESFDVYIYRLDEPKDDASISAAPAAGSPGPDGVTRPTKPYIPPDRGFGHEGFPAISMSKLAATEFCTWLSKKSGKHFRLPTEQEWEYACLAGSPGPYCFGDDASKLPDYAWFAADSDDAPHAVATKRPNAWGMYDMHGNVAEWCETSDGKGVVKGGSYQWQPDDEKATSRRPADRNWNASDPQVPKSKWWLANGPFIGFRVVCDNVTSSVPPTSDQKPAPDINPGPDLKGDPKK